MRHLRWLPLVLASAATVVTAQDNPAVYITAGDAAAWSPASAVSATAAPGKWFQRKVGFAGRGDYIFNIQAGGLYPDLTVSPRLRGRYNLYVNLREVNYLTGLQLKLSKQALAHTITPAMGTSEVHTNRDILWATAVDMTDQTILMRYIGRMVYFSYLKFVPVAADQPGLTVDPERVREEPLLDHRAEWLKTKDVVPEGMREIKHLPDQAAPPAPDAGRGYVIYARPYLDLVFPDTLPGPEDIVSELRVAAARGEYEPIVFSVYATRDLGPCHVTVDDLKSGNKKIGKAAVSVAAVATRNLRTTFNGKTFMHVPAMLDPTMPVAIPASRSKQFWLTVHVPADAAPGDYTTNVTFAPASLQPARLKLTLRVHPFRLDEPRGTSLGVYDLLWAARADADWLRAHLADLRAHGMTSDGYCGGLNGEIMVRNGVAAVQFDGSCGLEQFLEGYKAAGFPQPVLWLMSGDIWDWCGSQAEPGSEQFDILYRQVIQSILRQCQARQWPGITFQPIDEPGSYEYRPNAAYVEQWAVESKLIKEAGGTVEVDHIPFSTTDERLKSALERALPCIDVFTQRFSTRPIWFEQEGWWWDNMKRQAAEWGKQLWSYNINDAAFFPELATHRLAYGHFLWLEQARGQLLWSYQQVAENPLNALDGNYTDMMYTYPSIPEAGVVGGPSLMWECIREGTDDLRYVRTLERLIAEAEARGAAGRKQAAPARTLLAQLRASFDRDRLRQRDRYIECQWDAAETAPDGQQTVSGHFNVPNGWGLADYDRWRRAMADQIVRLSR